MNILVVSNDHVQIHIVSNVCLKGFLRSDWWFVFFFLLIHTEINHLPWNMISRTEESKSGFRKNMYHKGFEPKKCKPENCCCM